MNAETVMERIRSERVIGICRADSADAVRNQVRAMRAAGVAVAEVSLTTPGALDVVSEQAAELDEGEVIGAGTVLDAASARMAVAAGARLLVSPILSFDVIRVALDHGVVAIPGCYSPTEMLSALQYGAQAVKLFPANGWTPVALHTMLRALPQLPVVPTGGVSIRDAATWLEAGAVAVGLGATLTSSDPEKARRSVGSLRL